MRIIKFRVWDNELKKHRTEKDGDYSLGVLSGMVRGIYGDKFPQMEVEQFTGFKDSKGIEIYEGDIIGDWVDCDGEMRQTSETVYFDERLGEWMLDSSMLQDKTYTSSLFAGLETFEYEVIGNIHENKGF